MAYSCKLCKYDVNIRASFDRHTRSQRHIYNEERYLICNWCNKKFDNIRQLKSHRYYKHRTNNDKTSETPEIDKNNDTNNDIQNSNVDKKDKKNNKDDKQNNIILKEINKNTKIIQDDVNGVKKKLKQT